MTGDRNTKGMLAPGERFLDFQLVAVPLNDGSFGLGHVARSSHLQMILVHFDHRAATPEGLLDGLEEALHDKQIAILAMNNADIRDGKWPVIGESVPNYPSEMLDMKGRSYLCTMAPWLFNAYYGLAPWDAAADPRFFEKALLPGVLVPPTVRYKRDFGALAPVTAAKTATTPAANDDSAPPITEGPGVIHIEIKYKGDGLPAMELLHRRQAVEDGLEAAGAGTVTDAGGGGGVMDIFLKTKDIARAIPFVRAALTAAGFERDARIEVEPMPDEDDSDGNSTEQDDH